MNKPVSLDLVIAGLLALAVLVVYWPLVEFDFVHLDDDEYVIENPHVVSGLSFRNIQWAFTTSYAANWHPLTWLSLMLDAQWPAASDRGLVAGGFHQTNVLLHALNSALVFLLFLAMTNERWPSLFVAALFGLHPLHVESVAWIAERKDVLSTFFGLLCLIAYVLYAARATTARYAVAIVTFILSLLSKQMLVTLPVVLLLLDFWPMERFSFAPGRSKTFRRQNTRRLLVEKLPFFVLSLISCLIVVYAQQHGNAVRSLAKYPVGIRLANAALSYFSYLQMTFWPSGLAVFYPYPASPHLIGYGAVAAVLVVGISAAVIWFRTRHPFVTVGWLWYVVTLLPVIGVIQVGDQALADRYTYVPHLGIFACFAWGLSGWTRRRPAYRAFGTGIGVAAVVVITWLTVGQIQVWRNSESLFLHAIKVTKANELAHRQLAYTYKVERRYSEAISHYDAALSIRPDAAEYRSNLGTLYLALGQAETALRYFREAERLDPDRPFILNNLAWILATNRREDLRNPAEAVRYAERSCALESPPNPAFLDTLAVAYAAAGRYDEAVRVALEARQLAEAQGLTFSLNDLDARVALFRAGKPYVEGNPK